MNIAMLRRNQISLQIIIFFNEGESHSMVTANTQNYQTLLFDGLEALKKWDKTNNKKRKGNYH